MHIPIPIIILILILLAFFSKYWRARMLAVIFIFLTLIIYGLILLWLFDIYLVWTDFNKFYLAGIFIIPIIVFILVEVVDDMSCYLDNTLQEEASRREIKED